MNSGHWVHRDIDIHRCQKPMGTTGVRAGDIWQCDVCQSYWRVERVTPDQRDPYIVWKADPNYGRNSLANQRDGGNLSGL